jgi:hypothetical protein
MGLLSGLSGSKSKSSSTSNAYGYSGADSLSTALGGSSSLSGGQSQSYQDLAFADLFANLYGDAAGAAGRSAQLVPGLQTQAGQLFSGGVGFLDQLGGGPGAEYLEGRISGPGLADEQIGMLGEDLGRFMREELNPAIASRGVATGTLGGGRQGVAEGRAAEGLQREFTRGALEIRGNEQAQRDALAAQAAGIRQQGAGAGLAALPGMYGLAEAGAMAEMSPYQALAQIMGGPTTLTTSGSSQFGESQAFNIAEAISQSFAEDWATSLSKGKSSSFGLSF